MAGQYRSGVLADRLEPDAALAWERAIADATATFGEGAVDDLVLLRSLLEGADDNLLKVMGPYLRRVLAELAADEGAADAAAPRRVPYGEHLLDAALNEAIDLTGRGDEIAGVHLVLALFFFPGCRATAILERCGIDWRPLRSLARRLTGISYYDW
jgi:hypothetical protein